MSNKATTLYYSILVLPLFLFFPTLFGAEDLKKNIRISIVGNDAVFLEPGSPRYEKQTVYYNEEKRSYNKISESAINVLITNLSDNNMAIIGLPFSKLIVTIIDTKGGKYMWPPYQGVSIGAFRQIIYLDKNETVLYPIPIKDFERYTPPLAGKEENIKVTAKFITSEREYERIPADLLKNKVKFTGEMESEQKELTVCSITGLIPTDKKVSEKKQITIGKEEGITVGNENKGKYINHDIIINHFEVEHFNLSDTIELLSNYLDEYIKKEYPGKDIKVKILNTLSGNDKNLPLITINADKITIENLVSMICKETGLKYVIGKDAIYIGY